jgi:hypothetical protein
MRLSVARTAGKWLFPEQMAIPTMILFSVFFGQHRSFWLAQF